MFLFIAQYCAAQESFALIRVSKEIRAFILGAKIVIFRQLFKGCLDGLPASLPRYFRIMESAGSKDLFVFYELLLWALREGNAAFL